MRQGWTGPKQLHGQFIEGSFHSHQVPLPGAKTDAEALQALEDWLKSYRPSELFTETGDIIDEIKSVIPNDNSKKLGQRVEACGSYTPPRLPPWKKFSVGKGAEQAATQKAGELIDEVFQLNPHMVRLFSPDELESNKLSAPLVHTVRNFQWDQFSNAQGGRIIEVLSEHLCQGFLQGYTLTGRLGIFPSYESFMGIIHTMMVQYAKFMKTVGYFFFFFALIFRSTNNPAHSLKKHPGGAMWQVSTTSKQGLGYARNTTVFPTRTHRSLGQC